MTPGERLTLLVEKPAAGGRMLARRDGAVVLVAGAIPGEEVEVEIEKVRRGTAWARVVRVVAASEDRIEDGSDGTCGGNVLAHVRYERQLTLKRDIIADAFARIARLGLPGDVVPASSPTDGYRMRARLHLLGGRLGFFREGTHELCPAGPTRQLLPSTLDVVAALEPLLAPLSSSRIVDVEVSENRAADQRALHLVLAEDGDPSRLGTLPPMAGVTGVSCGRPGARPLVLWGVPETADRLAVPGATDGTHVVLVRQAHAFFQGNRFLLEALVQAVSAAVPSGRILDLYAGVGLFAVTLAARGGTTVTAVEGDRTSARDLKRNAAAAGEAVQTRRLSVEEFLALSRRSRVETVVVDPPRTGMSREALAGVVQTAAARVVYVSCDIATLARDARTLVDAGYRLADMRAFDLFPRTAHVETLAVFDR